MNGVAFRNVDGYLCLSIIFFWLGFKKLVLYMNFLSLLIEILKSRWIIWDKNEIFIDMMEK